MEFNIDVIEEALLIYQEIYWEYTKIDPTKTRMGIRLNPTNGKKMYGTFQKINIDIFDYLVNYKSLLELDDVKNFSSGKDYFVFYTLRKSIQLIARKKALSTMGHKRLSSCLTTLPRINSEIERYKKLERHKLNVKLIAAK